MTINNISIRKFKGKVYFFNDEGVYVSRQMSDEEIMRDGRFPINIPMEIMEYFGVSQKIFRKAISTLNEGQNIEDFKRILSITRIEHREKPKGVDRFIGRIQKPIFERIPENLNKNSFDFIRIYVSFVPFMESEHSWLEYYSLQKYEISKKVVEKLSQSKSFKRYGIPINFLRLTNIILIKSWPGAEFLFELKEV